MMKHQPGFPKPYADLDTDYGRREFRRLLGNEPTEHMRFLVGMADVGKLRSTDPILGDLTVVLKDAYLAVHNRLVDLGVVSFASEDPDEQEAGDGA